MNPLFHSPKFSLLLLLLSFLKTCSYSSTVVVDIFPFRSGRNNYNMMSNDFVNPPANYNYYGLSASFLENLGITGPLHNKVFVANVSIV